jgi:hypothetical protein
MGRGGGKLERKNETKQTTKVARILKKKQGNKMFS